MSVKKAYLSFHTDFCETEGPEALPGIRERLEELNIEHLDYTQDVMFKSSIKTSDYFIAFLPEGKFKYDIDTLHSDERDELNEAIEYNIPIYVVYRGSTGKTQIYQTEIDKERGIICGIQGSWDHLETVCKSKDKTESPNPIYKEELVMTSESPAWIVHEDMRILL